MQNPTQPTLKPILNEQVDYIHFVYGGFDPTYWLLGNITEPEMIAGVVEVLNHPPPTSRSTGEIQFYTGMVSSELTVYFKPVHGVIPEPIGGQLCRDLFYNYGTPMREMMRRLGKFRAERARQLFAKRAGEIVKIEWINPTKLPFKESTRNKGNIASIVEQLKNVDERCFAYTDSVGVCPLRLFFRDGTTSLIEMELARDLTRQDVWVPDPTCPKWLLDYRSKLEEDRRKIYKIVPPPIQRPEWSIPPALRKKPTQK